MLGVAVVLSACSRSRCLRRKSANARPRSTDSRARRPSREAEDSGGFCDCCDWEYECDCGGGIAVCECKGRLRCEGIEESGSALSWRARSRRLVMYSTLGLSVGTTTSSGFGSRTHLLASVVLSSLLPVPAAEYHGWRSCLVGARGTPRSKSVIAGLDFEARATRAAACSSRSAKRLMCPLLNGMPDPVATGVILLPVSTLRGGEEGGVIPARARSVLRRDSASWRGFEGVRAWRAGRGDVLQREHDLHPLSVSFLQLSHRDEHVRCCQVDRDDMTCGGRC